MQLVEMKVLKNCPDKKDKGELIPSIDKKDMGEANPIKNCLVCIV